jgi:hypothetical protein
VDLVVDEILPMDIHLVVPYTDINSITVLLVYGISLAEWRSVLILTVVAQVLEVENYLYTSILFQTSDPVNNNYTEVLLPSMLSGTICLQNNDGLNRFFSKLIVANYPNNKLSVYNRYGNLVFAKENYNNDWQGMANVAGVVMGR